jgi:hypothetical protein
VAEAFARFLFITEAQRVFVLNDLRPVTAEGPAYAGDRFPEVRFFRITDQGGWSGNAQMWLEQRPAHRPAARRRRPSASVSLPGRFSRARVDETPPLPNNLGPTLLLILGVMVSPLLIGVPLILLGLSRVRTAEGRLALPQLTAWKRRIRRRFQVVPALFQLPPTPPLRRNLIRP